MSSTRVKQPSKGGRQPKGETTEAPPPAVEESQVLLMQERIKQQQEHVDKYRASQEEAQAELTRLLQERQLLEREHHLAATALRQELGAEKCTSQQLREELSAARATAQQARSAAAQLETEVVAAAAADTAAVQVTVAVLRAELAGLAEFQRQRDELQAATQHAQQEVERLTRDYEEKLGALHLRAHRSEQRVGELEREAAEQAAVAGAVNENEADAVHLLHQNRKLAAALQKCKEECEVLRGKAAAAGTTATELRRDLELSRDVEQEAVQRCARHAKGAAAATSQVASLQQQVVAAMAAQQEAEMVQAGQRAQLAAAAKEQAAVQRQLKHCTRQLRHAQDSLRDAIAQRSEAQAFLVSSIRYVRLQVAQREASAAAESAGVPPVGMQIRRGKGQRHWIQATPSASTLPAAPPSLSPGAEIMASSCPGSAPGSAPSSAPGSASSSLLVAAAGLRGRLDKRGGGRLADVSELSWQDRETVLRLLLAQVNASPAAVAARAAFSSGGSSAGELSPSTSASISSPIPCGAL